MNWWGKKNKIKEEPKIEFYNPQVNGEWKMKGGNTEKKMVKKEETEEEEFEEDEEEEEDEDLDAEEESELPKKKAVGRPQGSFKKKEAEEDRISVVAQLPTQQLRRAIVDGKATSFETIEEALSNMRNDLADIKKAVGA